MQPEKTFKIKVNDDERTVFRYAGSDQDFYAEDTEGYRGLEKTIVGKTFLTRSRGTIDMGNPVPWLEIVIGVILSIVVALVMAMWITRPIKQFVRQSRRLLELNREIVAVVYQVQDAEFPALENPGRFHPA